MLKKLPIGITVIFFVFFSYFSLAFADADNAEVVIGLLGNKVVASSNFTNKGFFQGSSIPESQIVDLNHDGRFSMSAYLGVEFPCNMFLGFEGGYKTLNFSSKGERKMIHHQNIDTRSNYIALKVDQSFNIVEGLDFAFGMYTGMANVSCNGFINFTQTNFRNFGKKFKNLIFGARAGFAHDFGRNMAFSLNYLFTSMPSIGNRELNELAIDPLKFSEFKYITHGIEGGIKMYF